MRCNPQFKLDCIARNEAMGQPATLPQFFASCSAPRSDSARIV
jgi:hypothetical protein